MIYEVYIDDSLLYYPNDETYAISNAVLETSLNEAGTFECDIPKSNLRYEEVTGTTDGGVLRKKMIRVLKDGNEIFNGEIREITQNFDFTKHLYAVGELAFLFDSIQPQHLYLMQDSPSDVFRSILASHNSQVEDRKKFAVGSVLVNYENDYDYLFYTNREDTLTAIREKLCNPFNGVLRIRKVGNIRYLDLVPVENHGRYCTQEIQFGENLLNYSCNYTVSDIATAVVPLGAKIDEDKRTAAAVAGLDEYLTIEDANDGKDYLQNDAAISRFGWVKVVKEWSDIKFARDLKVKAQEWLTSAQFANLQLEINAIDLNLLNNDIESFEVGDTIHCWAEPYGMDTTFPVRKKTIYLNDLSKNYIVLSNTDISKSYTSQASNAVSALKKEIPEISPFLVEAKERARYLLLDETQGGHVVYEYHYNSQGVADYIEAINICNSATLDASTKRWRWSQTGFGYLSRNNISVPWQESTVPIAITMNGEIVADYIKTGSMQATRIKGGTLEVGGDGTAKDGKIEVKNSSGTVLITLDKNGMTLSGGQTISWNNISGKPEIPTDVNQLSDADKQKWSSTIGDSWIQTTTVTAKKLVCNVIQALEGKIAGWDITKEELQKEVKDGNVSVSSTLKHNLIRFVAKGWKRTLMQAGLLVVNVANADNLGIYVCNGGSNTDSGTDGTWTKISPNGITGSDNKYVPWATNSMLDGWFTTGVNSSNQAMQLHFSSGLCDGQRIV